MAKGKLFKYLAAASGYVGLGLILGYVLSDQLTNTPLWVGIILTLLGAVLMGMFISARDSNRPANESPASSANRTQITPDK